MLILSHDAQLLRDIAIGRVPDNRSFRSVPLGAVLLSLVSNDQVCGYVMRPQIRIPLSSVSILHFVFIVQALQRLLCYVYPPKKKKEKVCNQVLLRTFKTREKALPREAACFHVVGEGHVIRPHIELPLPETKNSAVNSSSVNTNSHVHFYTGHSPHQAVPKNK